MDLDNNAKIRYLNGYLSDNFNFCYRGPQYLYKYRPFDEYTFSMLEKNELFLCPVNKLDDKTECDVSLNIKELASLSKDKLKIAIFNKIRDIIKPYCNESTLDVAFSMIEKCIDYNGNVNGRLLLEMSTKIEKYAPGVDTALLVNSLNNVPRSIDTIENKELFEDCIRLGLEAKNLLGVCSLSEDSNNAYMWDNYSDNHTGYCIEYDVSNYIMNDNLLPVIYLQERNINLFDAVINTYINQFIKELSSNHEKADITEYIRLFLTKNIEWMYQKEWRIIGKPGTLIEAPKINKIIIGKAAKESDISRLISFCKTHNIRYVIEGM